MAKSKSGDFAGKAPSSLAWAAAEGYPTARAASELARKHSVETPISEEVDAKLYEAKDVRQVGQDLTARESKAED